MASLPDIVVDPPSKYRYVDIVARARHSFHCLFLVLPLLLFLYWISFIKPTAKEIAIALRLQPALEGLLLSAGIREDIITAFRVQKITDSEFVTALDSTDERFKVTC